MEKYVLLFRMDIITESAQPNAEQMQSYMTSWMKWIDDIAAKEQLAEGGNHFSKAGKLLMPKNTITDGPYTANKESVAGYIIILAKGMDDAINIAQKCPILEGEGTSIEIRETATPQGMKNVKRT
jgi:hypothetical protein